MSHSPGPKAAGLPPPDADARAHMARVQQHIRRRIEDAGGWIPFAVFMDLALHAPGLGYYAAGSQKFGSLGDFVTAPEMTPLFGRTLAIQVADILRLTDGDVLEIGAGSGALAADMLAELERIGVLPRRYLIFEPSAELVSRQRQHLRQREGQNLGRCFG